MSVLIGHASISEKGTINGVKGDQTQKEVCTRTFYSAPWDYAAIHPDINVREKHANAVEDGCANDNIGYGQSDRNTLNTEAKKVNYDLSKITTPCNTDCSEFQNVCAVASGAPGVTHGSNGWTTSTMKSALQNAGYKIITDKTYLASADYCVRGAIYVKSGSHTVCGLTNGSKYSQTLSKAGLTSSSTSTTTTTPTSNTYTVVKGDTLSGIGAKLKIDWKSIAELNGIKSPYVINIGQILKLPTTTSSNSNNTTINKSYKVKITAKSGLNIRNGAGTNYGKVGAIPYGTTVTITDELNGWGKTIYNNINGYISLEYTNKV